MGIETEGGEAAETTETETETTTEETSEGTESTESESSESTDGNGEQIEIEAEAEGEGEGEGEDKAKNPKRVAAGKTAADTKKKAAARRAELREDKAVQKLLADAEAKGAKEARETAKEEARRAQMSEVERANAERDAARAERDEAQTNAKEATLDREYANAVMNSETRLIPKARKTARGLVSEAMKADSDLSVDDALALVLEEHDYLVQASDAPAAPAKRSSSPKPKRTTATPSETEPKKPVDVTKMTPQQFSDHRKTEHGIQH